MQVIIIGGSSSSENFITDLTMRIVDALGISYTEARHAVLSASTHSLDCKTPDSSTLQLELLRHLEQSKSVKFLEEEVIPPFNFMCKYPPVQKKNRRNQPDKRSINRKNRKRKCK